MVVIGIDMGVKQHGVVVVDAETKNILLSFVTIFPNSIIPQISPYLENPDTHIVFEIPIPYGTAATSLFATSANIGIVLAHIFHKLPPSNIIFMPRPFIKYVLLGTVKGKDKDIRDFLRLHYGDDKLKSARVKKDAWAALAAATAYLKTKKEPDYDVVKVWRAVLRSWLGEGFTYESVDVDDSKVMQSLLKEENGDVFES